MLAKILFDDRVAHQYDPRAAEDTDMIVQTFLPITRSVPLNRLYESYVGAVEARAPGNNFQITAGEIVQAWRVLEGRIEMESKGAYDDSRALPSRAAAACSRCQGTGWERMPDGTRRKGCLHDEWTPEDERELRGNAEDRAAQIKRGAEMMKEVLKTVGSPKPAPAEVRAKVRGTALRCSNPSCPRHRGGEFVNTLYGFEEGGRCGELLNRGSNEPDLEFCEGRMSPRAPA